MRSGKVGMRERDDEVVGCGDEVEIVYLYTNFEHSY